MNVLTIDEAAAAYAAELGCLDYPSTDCCPYNANVSEMLYAAYWQSWHQARRTELRLKLRPRAVA